MVTLPLPEPYDADRTLGSLRLSSLRTPYTFFDGRRVRRLIHLHGRPTLVEFEFPASVRRLRARVVGRPIGSRRANPGLRDLAVSVWGLDDDLRRGLIALRRDPGLAPLLRRYAGLRMVRTPDLYEVLLMAVVGQQISVASAESIRRRLMHALGARVVVDGTEFVGYPAPDRLRATAPHVLQKLGTSRQKARYLIEIAERAAAGRLDRAAFERLGDEEAVAMLTEIPGVGRWTAEVALMRGLGRRDVFPAADIGLMTAAQRLLKRADKPREDELRAIAERWKGWRSYAALYLWRSLQKAT